MQIGNFNLVAVDISPAALASARKSAPIHVGGYGSIERSRRLFCPRLHRVLRFLFDLFRCLNFLPRRRAPEVQGSRLIG